MNEFMVCFPWMTLETEVLHRLRQQLRLRGRMGIVTGRAHAALHRCVGMFLFYHRGMAHLAEGRRLLYELESFFSRLWMGCR